MNSRLDKGDAGFSLIEALISVALMGMVLIALGEVTSQWLSNWDRGFAALQDHAIVERGLERLVADISAAEYVPLRGGEANPLFVGLPTSITFVRTSIGPNTKPGLEIVRLAETAGRLGPRLVRTRARFTPGEIDANPERLPPLGDPVALLQSPYAVTFSYAGDDQIWKAQWEDAPELPRTVRISLRDPEQQRAASISTIVTMRVDAPAACQQLGGRSGCAGDANKQTQPISAVSDNTSGQAQ
jgi:general secretion pathway protein J